MKKLLLLILFLFSSGSVADPRIYEKQYDGFTIWLDCERHGAVAFYYEIGRDTGNVRRSKGRFKIDETVPPVCQPTSTRSYRTDSVDPATGTWDRGHLVPANHMDDSETSLQQTFYLTNILPQQSTFNQSTGAWHQTEIITECYRDVTELHVWGGVVWGSDASNDFFLQTHNVQTPDFWWKVIYRPDTNDYQAWLFPNHRSATAADIDNYLLSIPELKAALEFVPDFGILEDTDSAATPPASSWPVYRKSGMLTCEGITTPEG